MATIDTSANAGLPSDALTTLARIAAETECATARDMASKRIAGIPDGANVVVAAILMQDTISEDLLDLADNCLDMLLRDTQGALAVRAKLQGFVDLYGEPDSPTSAQAASSGEGEAYDRCLDLIDTIDAVHAKRNRTPHRMVENRRPAPAQNRGGSFRAERDAPREGRCAFRTIEDEYRPIEENRMALDFSMMNIMAADMEARIAESNAQRKLIEVDYEKRRIRPKEIGSKSGPVHAASILIWARLAQIANIPFIPADVVATFDMATVTALADGADPATLPADQAHQVAKADAYAAAGGYWRTEICAGEEVKHRMGAGQDLPDILPVRMNDLRIYEMHYGMPSVTIVGRPKLTPVRHTGYPVEFRVFNGCAADQDGAVSWYYPQAGAFEPTPELEAAMTQAAEWGVALHALRAELGLAPWLPGQSEPDHGIGSTIDFMLSEEMGLVMVDAGPGFGAGAHPCCFIDSPVQGRAWKLADGVELR